MILIRDKKSIDWLFDAFYYYWMNKAEKAGFFEQHLFFCYLVSK